MISLTDLKAKRAAMTQGEYERMGHTIVSPQYDIGRCDSPSDADGIVATHNAADVLIEIAEAALVVRAAMKRAAVAQFAWARAQGEPDESPRQDAVDNANRHLEQCRDRLDAALAKITT